MDDSAPRQLRDVTDRDSNPFDMQPACDQFVPGYGDVNAHFHVIGDHPGVHGGTDSGIPFTDTPGADRLQRALVAGGLLRAAGTPPAVDRTYLSYRHMCVPEPDEPPDEADYDRLEAFFDAELRAITAHVLLPVGVPTIRHVLRNYTAEPTPEDPAALHATEIRGSGFLVVPIADPTDWTDEDERRLVTALKELQATDYRREADLGRFLPGGDPYFVR